MKMFPGHIACHQSTYFDEEELLRKAKNTSANLWSRKWRARLNIEDVRALLAFGCTAARTFLEKSEIPQKAAGTRVFVRDLVGAV